MGSKISQGAVRSKFSNKILGASVPKVLCGASPPRNYKCGASLPSNGKEHDLKGIVASKSFKERKEPSLPRNCEEQAFQQNVRSKSPKELYEASRRSNEGERVFKGTVGSESRKECKEPGLPRNSEEQVSPIKCVERASNETVGSKSPK